MRPWRVVAAVWFALLALPLAAHAQPGGASRRVGILGTISCPNVPMDVNLPGQSLLAGLRESGFVEGVSVIFDHRGSGGTLEDLPRRAADLVRRKVDVILAVGDGAEARAASWW